MADLLLAATPVITGDDTIEAIKVFGGLSVVGILLFVASYGAYSAFMQPGTWRQHIVRGLVAIGAVVAIVFLAPLFWGPKNQ